jgi:hypothetical protein
MRAASPVNANRTIPEIARFASAIQDARLSMLGLTTREAATDPLALEVIDNTGLIVADIRIRGSAERLQQYLRTDPPPFLGEPDC